MTSIRWPPCGRVWISPPPTTTSPCPVKTGNANTQMPASGTPPCAAVTVPEISAARNKNVLIPLVVLPSVTATVPVRVRPIKLPLTPQSGRNCTRYPPVPSPRIRYEPSLWLTACCLTPAARPLPEATTHTPPRPGPDGRPARTVPVITPPMTSLASIPVTCLPRRKCSAVAFALEPTCFHHCGAYLPPQSFAKLTSHVPRPRSNL